MTFSIAYSGDSPGKGIEGGAGLGGEGPQCLQPFETERQHIAFRGEDLEVVANRSRVLIEDEGEVEDVTQGELFRPIYPSRLGFRYVLAPPLNPLPLGGEEVSAVQ